MPSSDTMRAPGAGRSRGRATPSQKLLLAVASPLVFLAASEALVRGLAVETELARNENFAIAVPAWLLADPGWVQVQQERIASRGVRAEDVAWLQHFEEARYIQYRLKPGIDVPAVNPFNDIEVEKGVTFRLTSNRRGFRGPDVPVREAGRLRVVTLGDSSTFGWGVDRAYTFQELLAARLRARSRPAEVLNFGMPGFTSRHGLGVQQHYAHDLEPDVVVISFGANDARYGLTTADAELDVDDTWQAGAAWTLRRLESFKLLRKAIFSFYDPFVGTRNEPERPAPVRSVPVEDYERNLTRLLLLAQSRGAEGVFLTVCAPDEYREAMRRVATRRRVPMVDALDLFLTHVDALRGGTLYREEVAYYENLYGADAMEANWRYYVTTDGCHPNRAGHSVIADALVPAIEAALAGRKPS